MPKGQQYADDADPVLEAVAILRAAGIEAMRTGDDLESWQIGDFTMTDADVLRLADRLGD